MSHVQETYDKTVFGFWCYLMTDCILFGILFACYAVLHKATHGGPNASDVVNLHLVLAETMALLASSFTCALSGLASNDESKQRTILALVVTFFLGFSFVFMEIWEFIHLVQEGNSWERSAFLSSFFTLIATHGLHISCGLIWIAVMMVQVLWKGFTQAVHRRLMCLRMFWHFLDVVWIFIFTFVYLMGANGA